MQLLNRFKDFVSSSKNTKQLNFNLIKDNFKAIDTHFENIKKDILEIKNYVKYETLKTFNHFNHFDYELEEINDLLNNEIDEIYSGKKVSFSEKIVSKINEIKQHYSRLKNLNINKDKFGEDESCILLGKTLTNLGYHSLKLNEQYNTNELIELKSTNDIENMIEYLLDGRINSLRYDTSRSSKEHIFMINESLKKTNVSCENIGNIMKSIDRKDFISNNEHPYVDKPIIIGWNTTISAPHMQIITLFNLSKFSNKFKDKKLRALDIGSGSGYMTLCLSKLLGPYSTVIGIDHIKDIVLYSICNINKNHGSYIQTERIKFICKDGRSGDKENGPYHIIHFGAALEEIPYFMVDQLEKGGVMWIPVGPKGPFKKIMMIHKEEDNKIVKQELMNVNYTELVSIEEQLKINSESEELNEDIENSD
jgi:protein-L-isoaspartate(D-aspartate) O-methyltransferase